MATETHVELERFGFADVSLIEGERIDSALDLSKDGSRESVNSPEVMLLTDRRVIHLHGSGKRRNASFASIQDINGVELTVERQGTGAFIWAGLAFVVAILLYFALKDHSVWRVVAPITVALMGAYLIVDQRVDSGAPVVTFKAGSSQLQCTLQNDGASSDVYTFINRLYQLKEDNTRGRRFAPR